MADRKELLEKLKQVRLELFRSAADLDVTIQGIEYELSTYSDEEEIPGYIRAAAEFRDKKVHVKGWDELYKLEQGVWQQLI